MAFLERKEFKDVKPAVGEIKVQIQKLTAEAAGYDFLHIPLQLNSVAEWSNVGYLLSLFSYNIYTKTYEIERNFAVLMYQILDCVKTERRNEVANNFRQHVPIFERYFEWHLKAKAWKEMQIFLNTIPSDYFHDIERAQGIFRGNTEKCFIVELRLVNSTTVIEIETGRKYMRSLTTE